MKNILLILLTAMAMNVAGQGHLVGVKGGVNFTNITSKYLKDTDYRIGATTGVTYEYRFKNCLSVGADLIYDQRGYLIEDLWFTDAYGNILGNGEVKYHYDYISLPLKIGFNFGNKFFGLANIGVIPSLLVNAKGIAPYFVLNLNIIEEKHKYDVSDGMRKFDLAGFVEIGAGYKFCDHYSVFASFAYQHSFRSFTDPDMWGSHKIYNNGMSFNIGVKYALKI
ncbi:PorT family protein [Bacteroidales bacterium OttesenSCG-928-J16]|nr:PorT family protein [Bacteroidales bacterium OttesenSCG-928-J16]